MTAAERCRFRQGMPATPAFLYLYVEDADAHRRAVDAGARSLEAPLDTPHGDRGWGNVRRIATFRG